MAGRASPETVLTSSTRAPGAAVVCLVGYRGCGKSTLAPLLARAWGWDWIDADVELERQAGRSVKELFETEGESGFRTRERNLVAELLRQDRLVLATGGGAVLNETTRSEMRGAGPVVWLRASAEELHARIAGDPSTTARRPNLAGGGLAEVAEMLSRREPLYREVASVVVDVAGKAPNSILAEVLAALGAEGASS
jgi:shikimate kinase